MKEVKEWEVSFKIFFDFLKVDKEVILFQRSRRL